MSKRTKKTKKTAKFDEIEFKKIAKKNDLSLDDVKRVHKEFEV